MTTRAQAFPFPRYRVVHVQILRLMSAYGAYTFKLELAGHAKHRLNLALILSARFSMRS